MNEWEFQLLEDKPALDHCVAGGFTFHVGDRARLRPRTGGDIMDVFLSGKIAIIEAIEQDYEGKIQMAVVIEDDPGKDLGMLRQPGHRFFFGPDEIEPVARILIACIGNIFLGDDGFGVEVAQRLATRSLPPGVIVKDFGIRGLDLTYALLDPYDLVILVDASQRGGEPGTVYLIEPEPAGEPAPDAPPARLETHGMNPMQVLRTVRSMGGAPNRILIVGCEPAELGSEEEGKLGLSQPVTDAIDEAVRLIEKTIATSRRLLEKGDLNHGTDGTHEWPGCK